MEWSVNVWCVHSPSTKEAISIVPSMWFWSVSWSTNCLVYFTFFWSAKEKIVQSQIFFVHQRLTKNSLRLNKFFFGRPKKVRNRPDNWSTKRLTKTTWTGLLYPALELNPLLIINRGFLSSTKFLVILTALQCKPQI